MATIKDSGIAGPSTYYGSHAANSAPATYISQAYSMFCSNVEFKEFHFQNIHRFKRIDVYSVRDGRHGYVPPSDKNRRCYYFCYEGNNEEVSKHACLDTIKEKTFVEQ